MLYLRKFGGLSVSMLGLSLMFMYLLKVGFVLEQFKNTGFLKLDWCTWQLSCKCTGDTCLWLVGCTHMGNAAWAYVFKYTCVCICIIHLYFLCHYA